MDYFFSKIRIKNIDSSRKLQSLAIAVRIGSYASVVFTHSLLQLHSSLARINWSQTEIADIHFSRPQFTRNAIRTQVISCSIFNLRQQIKILLGYIFSSRSMATFSECGEAEYEIEKTGRMWEQGEKEIKRYGICCECESGGNAWDTQRREEKRTREVVKVSHGKNSFRGREYIRDKVINFCVGTKAALSLHNCL